MKLLFILYGYIVLFCYQNCQAQKETNIWYFGQNAGLNFNSGSPIALLDGLTATNEGGATISDSVGNLLFYTNGIRVWNKQHTEMPNAKYLNGTISTTQSSIIIPQPGSKTIYYIFTLDEWGDPYGLQYSKVDLTLDGGLGDIVYKNIPLHAPSCEKLTAVQHCNKVDYWVISHDLGSNAFRSYLITSTGVNTTPVITNAGMSADPTIHWAASAGQMKVSSDGKRIATANTGYNIFEIFDFNNSTGVVSNAITLPSPTAIEGAYGVEFSPDGTKLYGTTVQPGKLIQFDLAAGSPTAIANSLNVIYTGTYISPLQIGPDKKIYLTKGNYLGVINKPNLYGAACAFVPLGVSLLGRNSAGSLPNFITSYFETKPEPLPFSSILNCMRASFTAPIANANNPVTSSIWNFGDPSSASNNSSNGTLLNHLYSTPGTYTITLTQNYTCGFDIIKNVIVIQPHDTTHTPSIGAEICAGQTATLSGNIQGKYTWSAGDSSRLITVSPPHTTTYTVHIIDSDGCSLIGNPIVIVKPLPLITTSFIEEDDLNFRLLASQGLSYDWWPAEALSCSHCESPIASYGYQNEFCVNVTDENNCIGKSCITLTVSLVYIPNAFTPNNDNLNDSFLPVINAATNYSLLIFNRWGDKIFESTDPSFGWNGNYIGKACPDDIYCYNVKFTEGLSNINHSYTGKVALYR